MFYILEIVLCLLFVGLWWYRNDQKKYSNRPPGPLRIPVFGNLLQIMMMSKFPAIAFWKLADIYGDVIFVKMGDGETVVCCSSDSIREMLSHDNAVGRTQFEPIRDRHNNRNLGVIWGYGQPWQTLRRFTVRNLRDYGFGKSVEMDTVINDELSKFVAHLKCESSKAPGNILHVEDMFNLTLVNVLWRLVSGKSYDYNDKKMIHLLKLNDDFFQSTKFCLDVTDTFPILREWFPDWAGRTIQKNSAIALYEYGKELLEEHRQLVKKRSEPESFIDVFAEKVEQSKDDPETDFTDEQFVFTILDLLIGGSETSSKTLTFGILYMLIYPEVQQKIQQELDNGLPPGMQLTSSMKEKFPYTTAAVLEVLRYSTILPIPTAREASDDFYFRGYLIKKGTCLMSNVYAVHFSESFWGDPQNFRPERFLNSTGTRVEKKYADVLLSFGAGKRLCLGITLAECTLFLYFATMLRNFKFEKVPGTNPTMEPRLGVTNSPHPFDVKITYRNEGLKSGTENK